MNTFKTLGHLTDKGGLRVHSSLLTIVPHDSFPFFLLTITQGVASSDLRHHVFRSEQL